RRAQGGGGESKPARSPKGSPAAKLRRLERELADLERQIAERRDSITAQFDAVLGILERWGHVDGWALTDAGERTVRIYHELDLLVAEAIGRGLFDDLSVADTAGLASLFVYEHRSKEEPPEPWYSSSGVADRAAQIIRMAGELNREERRAHLTMSREPDPTMFAVVHAWAAGLDLVDVLDDELLTGGDFVRTAKQLIDLLRQIGDAAPSPDTRHQARAAADAVARGVVVSTAEDLDEALEHDQLRQETDAEPDERGSA
ncbi:MAG: hypothetical protein HKN26_10300, partial [Acidimicrobiales bacterium]|nr:hypothetical protein [Acidimicrobiales bacterium]